MAQFIVAASSLRVPKPTEPRKVWGLTTHVYNRFDSASNAVSTIYTLAFRHCRMNYERLIRSQTSSLRRNHMRAKEEAYALSAFENVRRRISPVQPEALDMVTEEAMAWLRRAAKTFNIPDDVSKVNDERLLRMVIMAGATELKGTDAVAGLLDKSDYQELNLCLEVDKTQQKAKLGTVREKIASKTFAEAHTALRVKPNQPIMSVNASANEYTNKFVRLVSLMLLASLHMSTTIANLPGLQPKDFSRSAFDPIRASGVATVTWLCIDLIECDSSHFR
eukprot:608529-Amphidinium_carterae.1